MQKTVQQLNEIFQKEIPSMECGRILKEVSPLGGKEKAKAVLDPLRKTEGKISDLMYVGDSITDLEALILAKEEGLAISFNGNAYALRAAEIACLSPHTLPLEILAEVFCQKGKKGVFNLVKKWPNTLERKTKEKILTFKPLPELEIITQSNLTDLIKKSEKLRKELRGEIVGKLG
jgi:energy-converting hydrogenase A subunit R